MRVRPETFSGLRTDESLISEDTAWLHLTSYLHITNIHDCKGSGISPRTNQIPFPPPHRVHASRLAAYTQWYKYSPADALPSPCRPPP